MLGHDVKHFEDMRLCVPICHEVAVAVLSNRCAGLCHPAEDMHSAHNNTECRKPVSSPLLYLHSHPSHANFENMWVA